MVVGFKTFMVKMRKQFPIQLTIYKRYMNAFKPYNYEARYEKVDLKTDNGVVSSRNLFYIDRGAIKKLPNFELDNWNIVDGKLDLQLLQVDLNTFMPLKFDQGVLFTDAPDYEWELVYNEAGEATDYKRDEKGVPIVKRDEHGKAIIKGYKRIEVLNTNIMLENGQTKAIPVGKAVKTYDREQWSSREHWLANQLYNKKSSFEKWFPLIILILGILGLYLVGDSINKNMNDLTTKNIEASKVIAQSNAMVADRLAQLAIAINPDATRVSALPTPPPS